MTQYITNGTFDSDISGWTDNSTDGNYLSWNVGGALDGYAPTPPVDDSHVLADQEVTGLTIGNTYTVSFDTLHFISEVETTATVYLYVGTTEGDDDVLSLGPVLAESTTLSGNFVATTTTVYVGLHVDVVYHPV